MTIAVAPAPAAGPAVGGPPSAVAMRATVHSLRACLVDIPGADRRLLAQRFGVGGKPQQSEATLARRMHTNAAAVLGAEVAAIGRLTAAHQQVACAPQAGVAASAASTSSAVQPAAVSAPFGFGAQRGAGSRNSDGGQMAVTALLLATILGCLVVAAREFRRAL